MLSEKDFFNPNLNIPMTSHVEGQLCDPRKCITIFKKIELMTQTISILIYIILGFISTFSLGLSKFYPRFSAFFPRKLPNLYQFNVDLPGEKMAQNLSKPIQQVTFFSLFHVA